MRPSVSRPQTAVQRSQKTRQGVCGLHTRSLALTMRHLGQDNEHAEEEDKPKKTRWSSHINVEKSRSRLRGGKKSYLCSKFSAYKLTLLPRACNIYFLLSRHIVTLHQGQGYWHEHEHYIVWYPYVYRHARIECNRLNTVRDMAIIVQVKHLSSLRRIGDLEWRARSSEGGPRLSRRLVGLSSQQTW